MQGCRICQGKSKTRCMFCGFRLEKLKAGKTFEEQKAHDDQVFRQKCHEDQMEYLRSTRAKLIKYRMMSTGCGETDRLIIKMIGDWRDSF